MGLHFETAHCLNAVPSVKHGFFTRHGGVSRDALSSLNCSVHRPGEFASAVLENRNRALCALGLADYTLVTPPLAHGSHSIIVDEATDLTLLGNADAVITSRGGFALGITYADCLPILVASTDSAVIAAIHAGWRGIQCNVISSTVARLRSAFGVKNLVAAVGPAISQQGFTVTDEVFDYFQTTWPSFVCGEDGKGNVDLTGIACAQLADADVAITEKVGGYTDLDSSKYFSHRRDRGETGRHIALIAKSK